MKNLLIALMLVLMGQRWDELGQGFTTHAYVLVYVIGEVETNVSCSIHLQLNCRSLTERFTIPVPNTPSKAMTKDEAERANKELMK